LADYKVRIKQLLALREKDTIGRLSEVAGVNANTIRSWFSRKSDPKAKDMVAIAKALGTTAEYLMTGEGPESATEYHNQIEEEICEWIKGLAIEYQQQVYGFLKAFNMIQLPPHLSMRKDIEKGGAPRLATK
jgi:transcriptional regulator with XRE-family HTH domain